MPQTQILHPGNRSKTNSLKLCGLDCAGCAAKLEKKLARTPGVESARVSFGTGKLTVRHTLSLNKIISLVKEAGYTVEQEDPRLSETTVLSIYQIQGLDCADCAGKLKTRLLQVPGVEEVELNFGTARLSLRHTCPSSTIIKLVRASGYGIRPVSPGGANTLNSSLFRQQKVFLTVLSGLFIALGLLSSLADSPAVISETAYLLAILAGGYYIGRSALYSLRSFSLDMNVLMTLALIGALAIGERLEGAALVFLFSLGSALQTYTVDKARNSIHSLIALSPKEALVRRNGLEIELPAGEIRIGDTLLVRPGERIAMDGYVQSGFSNVDQSPLTGESQPVAKKAGEMVYAGTVNGHGYMEIMVTRNAKDNTLARIINLIEEAQAQKAPSQQFVDIFARIYTPLIIAGSVLTAVFPVLVLGQPFAPWFEKALILLVVSCPCALVISTPVSIVAAIGGAAKKGVLIKGGAYLEEAGALKVVAFDKTGTLTTGHPEVVEILPAPGYSQQELLEIAASLEQRSVHPLAGAILRAAEERGLKPGKCSGFKSFSGRGVSGEFEGTTYYAGNKKLFEGNRIPPESAAFLEALKEKVGIPVLVGSRQKIIGALMVAEKTRCNAVEAVEGLRRTGIDRIVILTGDSPGAAAKVAGRLGVDEVYSGLLPEDKLRIVRLIMKKYGKLAMVGDGINDTPALAAATLGIAMGAAGTDTALETADIALMGDDLANLPYIIRLGRSTLQIIKQNIAFSLLVKGVFIALTFAGLTSLWMAVFADTGASLLVVLNGMRLFKAGSYSVKKNQPVCSPELSCSKA